MPDYLLDSCTGIGHQWGGTYWPVLYDKPLTGSSFSAKTNLFAMSEWSGQYSKFTIAGGKLWFAGDQYMIVGRHSDDTADLVITSGGIGGWIQNPSTGAWLLSGPTRWLRIGRADSTGGGQATMTQTGGKVYAQAMSVGNPDGSSVAGSSATISDTGELYVGGDNYFASSFDIAANASMDIGVGGLVELSGDNLKANALKECATVAAMGALNINADGTGSGKLVIPVIVTTAAQLYTYFGYDDGLGGITPGNVNAIYNGGAGQFVFTQPGGVVTEVTVIPEPATIALLGIGGLCLLRRKRN
jgi:hypothetical protein